MVTASVLGIAQDAGLPQAGCDCENCRTAWASPAQRQWVAALGLFDHATAEWFLIDATPDFREQLHWMQTQARGRLAGILLTHAHIGHYTGLIHLGYEAMAVRGLPLFGTASMMAFLRAHAPWRQLVEQGQVILHELEGDAWRALSPSLHVLPLRVPHRGEWSDTVAFIVRGPRRQLLYLPDIDSWEGWARRPEDVVAGVDVALLDGSFFSADELPGRDVAAIGHPLVTETVKRLAHPSADVRFIHLNHSNPLHRRGPERAWLEAQGFRIAQLGDQWRL